MKEKIVLIYGLSEIREKHVGNSDNKLYQRKVPLCIDAYNKVISDIIDEEYKNGSIFDSMENLSTFSAEWINYIWSEHPDWKLWDDYFYLTQINPKNELKTIYKELIGKKNDFKDYLHIDRGCKIGLEISMINPGVEIHFCLDNIDFETVLSKKDLGKSVTSNELRYVYRNWMDLKSSVLFFENYEQVKAPWEANPELWKGYTPKKWQLNNRLESQEHHQVEVLSKKKKKRYLCDMLTISRKKSYQLNRSLTNLKEKRGIDNLLFDKKTKVI